MKLHVFRNDATDWYVAETAEEAANLCRKHHEGTGCTEEEMGLEFIQCYDHDSVSIAKDDDQSRHEKKTCAEWCLINGKGFLCSENY